MQVGCSSLAHCAFSFVSMSSQCHSSLTDPVLSRWELRGTCSPPQPLEEVRCFHGPCAGKCWLFCSSCWALCCPVIYWQARNARLCLKRRPGLATQGWVPAEPGVVGAALLLLPAWILLAAAYPPLATTAAGAAAAAAAAAKSVTLEVTPVVRETCVRPVVHQ